MIIALLWVGSFYTVGNECFGSLCKTSYHRSFDKTACGAIGTHFRQASFSCAVLLHSTLLLLDHHLLRRYGLNASPLYIDKCGNFTASDFATTDCSTCYSIFYRKWILRPQVTAIEDFMSNCSWCSQHYFT